MNIARAKELIAEGRMHPAGLAAFDRRDEERARMYASEHATAALLRSDQAAFRKNTAAWAFWTSQPAGYRKTATWWVVSAKRPETRRRRLAALIEYSANGERIPLLTPPSARRRPS